MKNIPLASSSYCPDHLVWAQYVIDKLQVANPLQVVHYGTDVLDLFFREGDIKKTLIKSAECMRVNDLYRLNLNEPIYPQFDEDTTRAW
jgi:hypothetical protein